MKGSIKSKQRGAKASTVAEMPNYNSVPPPFLPTMLLASATCFEFCCPKQVAGIRTLLLGRVDSMLEEMNNEFCNLRGLK